MPETIPSLKTKLVILSLALSCLVMVLALLKTRLLNPSLTVQLSGQEMHFNASDETVTQDMDEISALMQAVGRKPHDIQIILKLSESLLKKNQLEPAANFAKRAHLENPKAFEPLYLLGIILHRQGQYQEAKSKLVEALSLKDDAACRYSLAILYCYYLRQKDLGIAQLKAALKAPNLKDDLKQTLELELKKQTESNTSTLK